MDFSGMNYLAVAIAAIVGMISGAAWYGVLAKPWMKAAGVSEEDVNGPNTGKYVVALLAQFVIAYLLAGLIGHLDTFSLGGGIITALFCWIGFCLAPMMVNHRFQGAGWDLTAIDGGYWLVVFVLQGAIIGWIGL